ncbi:hypothetical protein [Cognatiluteimonas telluris]|uniref:hypothetical protein n=1 Tax=Cognatiluteimonas telluris TaxID=1104775 RepID=UPI00140DE61A|nr:hypothetical protein [Lysobacter telluris]
MRDRQRPFDVQHPMLAVLVLPFLALVAALAALFAKPVKRTRLEVASTIRDFVEKTGGPFDWDNFACGGRIEDPELESIRARCASLPEEFPPTRPGEYCGSQGIELMQSFVRQLASQ